MRFSHIVILRKGDLPERFARHPQPYLELPVYLDELPQWLGLKQGTKFWVYPIAEYVSAVNTHGGHPHNVGIPVNIEGRI